MKMVNIDPFYFLLLIELALILFVLTVYLFFRNRKHKDLYQKTVRKLNDLKSEKSMETFDRPDSFESALPEKLPEILRDNLREILVEEERQPLQDSGPAEFMEALQPDYKEGGAMPDQIRRLQRMVNSQKSAILELMCFKDVFEGARKRLALLQQDNSELQDKIKDFIEGGAEGTGFGEALAALEESNRDLDKYITVLDREDERLTEKFQAWEEEFKRISEDMETSSDTATVDHVKYAEILVEKEMLTARSKELQEILQEKDKNLEAMQAQYEDLEKEYMVLYRQQQAQQPPGQ